MNKSLLKLLLAAAAGLLVTGCYNDFDNPEPAKIYTDADFTQAGQTYISIADLKQMFYDAKGQPDAILGDAAALTIDRPLYTRGKVISNDRTGNIYKSLYIYDEQSQSAIELKIFAGNYIFHPVGQIVFVKLQGLVVGNYRGMLSVGRASSDARFANDNIETDILIKEHIFSGAQQQMIPADTVVVTAANYNTVLSNATLGRLVRFEGVTSKFGKAGWGFKNTFPNYFANSTSYDVDSPGWEDIPEWATWAAKRIVPGSNDVSQTFFFGSAWFTYGNVNVTPGNYVVRSSGYCSFRDGRIPADGTVVDITAIYTKFGSSVSNVAYQLLLITDKDVVVR